MRLLRFYPQNVHPSEALNDCEKRANRELWEFGRFQFCSTCAFDQCEVNRQLVDTFKEQFTKSTTRILTINSR